MRSKVNGDTKTLTPNMITLYEFEKPRLVCVWLRRLKTFSGYAVYL